jgi:hypothetical protein
MFWVIGCKLQNELNEWHQPTSPVLLRPNRHRRTIPNHRIPGVHLPAGNQPVQHIRVSFGKSGRYIGGVTAKQQQTTHRQRRHRPFALSVEGIFRHASLVMACALKRELPRQATLMRQSTNAN